MTTWAVNGGEAGASARALLDAESGPAGLQAPAQALSATVLDRAAERPEGLAARMSSPEGPLWKSVPVRMAFVPKPRTLTAAARGYAGAGGTTKKTASKTTSQATSKAASRSAPTSAPSARTPVDPALTATATELGFLRDKRLSVEDKLFMFMALMEKKGNKELEQAMEDYAAKRDAAQQAAKAREKAKAAETESEGGGGFLGSVVGAVQGVAKQLGGPLLASAATAVGMPFLAPAALSLGGKLSSDLVGAVAELAGIDRGGASRASSSRARTSTSTSTSTSRSASSAGSASQAKSDLDDFDEKYEMAKIQRLQEKQNAMFSCLSNILKSMHDTSMVAVNNIR